MGKQIFHYILLIFLISSCRIGKSTSGASNTDNSGKATAESSKDGYLNLSDFPVLSPNWLAFEASIDVRTPDQLLNVEGTIRLQKDKLLWASLRKFGFEVARIKADSSGIVVINRIESTYEQIPWASLKQRIGYPLDFAMAQTLLLGNIPARDQAIWTKSCDSLRCTWIANNAGIAYQVKSQKTNLQPYQIEMVSKEAAASLLAAFDGIISFERGATSANRQYQFKKKETGSLQLSIKMDGFEIDQIQKMPFAIPASYQRVD